MEQDAGVDRAGRRIQVLVCIALAMLVRLVLVQFKEVVGTDEAIYLLLGRNLWSGQGFTLMGYPITMAPPLFPALAGLLDLVVGDLERASNIIYILFGGLIGLPVYLLAREIYGHRVGIVSLILLMTIPGLNVFVLYWGSNSEAMYIFFVFWGLLATFHALRQGRLLYCALAGAALSLAYLSRSEGILFVAACGLALAVNAFRREGLKGVLKATPRFAAYLVAFFVLASPYLFFLRGHSEGGMSVSGKTKLILLVGAMDLEEREKHAVRLTDDGIGIDDHSSLTEGRTVLDIIRANPMALVGGSFFQFFQYFLILFDWRVFPFFLLPFTALAWYRMRRPEGRIRGEAFLLLAWAPTLVYLVFHIWYRYMLVAVPTFTVWAAAGIVDAGGWLQRRREGTSPEGRSGAGRLRWLPLAAAVIPLAGLTIAKPVRSRILVTYPLEYRIVGEWISEHTDPEAIIMARKPEIAFYADRLMAPLPNEPYPAVIKFARHHGVRYLVIDEYMVASRPNMTFLLESDKAPHEDLAFVHGDITRDRRTMVYRILDEQEETYE